MSRAESLDKELRTLSHLLREEPRTARDLARLTKCSKPTVYSRIARLRTLGYGVTETSGRAGTRGPAAAFFSVTSEPK